MVLITECKKGRVNLLCLFLQVSNKRQSKVELANEEILVRGVGSILD
jgi:hypothetical protein